MKRERDNVEWQEMNKKDEVKEERERRKRRGRSWRVMRGRVRRFILRMNIGMNVKAKR